MYFVILIVIIYFLLLSILIKKHRLLTELFGLFVLTIITFIIGLRYGVGLDYFSYEEGFNNRYNDWSYEYLYSFLRYFIKVVFDKFYYLTFILILITNIFIYLGLKKRNICSLYLLLSILIFISNTGIVFMNIMRQGVAVAIFFYASTFIKERKFWKYLLFILLGSGFHLSMLLLIPLYFIRKAKFSVINYLFAIIVCYLLVYTRVSQYIINFIANIIPKYSKYNNHSYLFNDDIKILSLGVLLNVIFIFALLLFVKKDRIKEFNFEINLYLIGTLFNILAISTFMFDRIGIYFFIFGIAVIPLMIKSVENKNKRIFLFILAVIVAIIFFGQSLIINPESLELEYKSIFSLP